MAVVNGMKAVIVGHFAGLLACYLKQDGQLAILEYPKPRRGGWWTDCWANVARAMLSHNFPYSLDIDCFFNILLIRTERKQANRRSSRKQRVSRTAYGNNKIVEGNFDAKMRGPGVLNYNYTRKLNDITCEEVNFGLWCGPGKQTYDFLCQFAIFHFRNAKSLHYSIPWI